MRAMPGMPEHRTHDHDRHETTSLSAASNIVDGTAPPSSKVPGRDRQAAPAEVQVHLIRDDLTTHKTPLVHERPVQQRNTNPKPFVWTKTAEEILNSPTRYLQRIPGAEH